MDTPEKATEETWNLVLQQHLRRYYRHKEVERIEVVNNMLNEPNFRVVYFTDGTFVTFAKRVVAVEWFRHHGGGRYGPRSQYEGRWK